MVCVFSMREYGRRFSDSIASRYVMAFKVAGISLRADFYGRMFLLVTVATQRIRVAADDCGGYVAGAARMASVAQEKATKNQHSIYGPCRLSAGFDSCSDYRQSANRRLSSQRDGSLKKLSGMDLSTIRPTSSWVRRCPTLCQAETSASSGIICTSWPISMLERRFTPHSWADS